MVRVVALAPLFLTLSPCLTEEFAPLGRVIVSGRDLVSQEFVSLSDDDMLRLKDAGNDTSQLFFVKAISASGPALAFTRACAVVESSFSCQLSVHLDVKGQFIGIGLSTSNPTCASAPSEVLRRKSSLSTTVIVTQTPPGPQPDTQSYIQRMEQEKLEKMKGDRGDNRSFLAKYVSIRKTLVVVQ